MNIPEERRKIRPSVEALMNEFKFTIFFSFCQAAPTRPCGYHSRTAAPSCPVDKKQIHKTNKHPQHLPVKRALGCVIE
jgi:hypothetical protein